MDIKPFQVHYKAGLDRSIKPGLHCKFATELEAQAQARLCKKFFEERHGPKAAIVGIVVDDDALAKQKEQEESDLPPELESQVEMTELELLTKLAAGDDGPKIDSSTLAGMAPNVSS